MKGYEVKPIDKRLELAKKKFLIDWKKPDHFDHKDKMMGPEKLFQIFKNHYLNSITVREVYE